MARGRGSDCRSQQEARALEADNQRVAQKRVFTEVQGGFKEISRAYSASPR